MAFLSGVLGAVKDDDAVKTYDKYITSGSLDSVLTKLIKQIGTGRAGLAVSVEQVKRWLEKYNDEVGKKTNALTNALNNLSGKLINGSHVAAGKNYYQDVSSKHNSPLADQLRSWTQTIAGIQADISSVENNNVNVLDSALNEKLMHEIKVVKSAVGMLKESAGNTDFGTQILIVDEQLLAQREAVINDIRNEVVELQNKLDVQKSLLSSEIIEHVQQLGMLSKERFENISKKIGTLSRKKLSCFNNIYAALKNARRFLDDDFRNYYKKNIACIFEDMKNYVHSLTNDNSILMTAFWKLSNDVKCLESHVWTDLNGLKDHINNYCKTVDTDATNNILVKDALKELGTAKSQLDKMTGKKVLNAGADENLENKFETNIKGLLSRLVSEVYEKIGELYTKIDTSKVGKVTFEEKKFEAVMKTILQMVTGIKGTNNNNGLDEIKHRVKQYAKKFLTKEAFEEHILPGWIDDILRNKGALLNNKLQLYLKTNGKVDTDEVRKLIDGTDVRLHDAIKNNIMQEIKSKITDFVKSIKISNEENIKDNVEAVRNACEAFADELGNKMKDVIGGINSSEIAKRMESIKELSLQKPSGYDNYEIIFVVNEILKQLTNTARKIGNQFSWLAGNENLAQKVDKITVDAINLHSQLQSATEDADRNGSPTSKIDDAIRGVSTAVNSTIEATFRAQLQIPLEAAVAKFNSTAVHQIKHAAKTAINKVLEKFEDNTGELNVAKIMYEVRKTEHALQVAVTSMSAQLEALCKLPSDVENDKNSMETIMDDLRKKLHETLNAIRVVVETADQEVDIAMKAVQESVSKAYQGVTGALAVVRIDLTKTVTHVSEDARQSVNQLNKAVTQRVEDGFSTLTSEVRALFADSHKADLEALHKCVETQLAAVKEIIRDDSFNGLKGFLKRFNENKNNLSEIKNLLDPSKLKVAPLIGDFRSMAQHVQSVVDSLLEYTENQIKTPVPGHPSKRLGNHLSTKLHDAERKFVNLLDHLRNHKSDRKYLYDNTFTSLLSHLSTSLSALQPSTFANPRHPELLDAVKKGLEGFVKEMGKVYVNGYDGGEGIDFKATELVTTSGQEEKLTDKGKNLSKVFLTILPILLEDLTKLNHNCLGDWKNESICEMNNKNENPLGKFLKRCGYKVAKTMTSKDGESECKKSRTGMYIYDKLATRIFDLTIVDHLKDCESNKDVKGLKKKTENFDHFDTLNCLYHHLEIYNDVWHIATWNSTRYPCSIFEMLCWLSGLMHNRVRSSMMGSTINEALVNPEEEKQDKDMRDNETEENQRNSDKAAMQSTSDDIEVSLEIVSETDPKVSLVSPSSISLPAYPNNITFAMVNAIVTHISATSYDVLTKILGTGNAQTMYACEFSNNALRLKYPTSGDECLDILLDILRRVFAVLTFLCRQCKRSDEYYGWRECQYGMAIPTTKSHCNKKATDEARCQPTCEATCQAKCQANCQPTSPLMSYLNDCLPGHLPHQLISVGCKAECKTCSPSSRAMPCLTPLGFRAFSGSTKTGKDLCEIIDKFLNFDDIWCIFALVPRPPSTLPEHFQFALSFVHGWDSNSADTLHTWVQSSMKKQSIDLSSGRELTECLRKTYGYSRDNHTTYHNNSKNAFLPSLCMNTTCSGDGVYCAPYLATLCHESYTYFVKKHVDTYVSWVVYLPWVFHQYLEKLRDAFQDIFCQDWGCHRCMHGDKCKRGKHGQADKMEGEQEKPYCQCLSIVRCKGTSPTFYKYGFTYGSAKKLELNSNYCSAFFSQLENVIKSDYFTNLFAECDNFLYYIRFPFMSLTLALWLLSLLYLLHIMVIRLDLLHIKSHLRSPSSHRIAAQSLLAAARVNKLNRVFYLQP